MNISRVILSAVSCLGLVAAALADTHYVAQAGQTPVEPYTNDWPSAASNIQDAVNQTLNGDTVLVSNGVYASGTTNVAGVNRVYIGKTAITVQSVNGPAVTIIKGRFHSGEPGAPGTITNGANAVRCVELIGAGKLIGFTLTNGACAAVFAAEGTGGGAHNYMGAGSAMLSNCVVVGNVSYGGCAGVRDVPIILNCAIIGNRSETGGAGGVNIGAAGSVMRDCAIIGNWAAGGAGGVAGGGSLYHCTIASNYAGGSGGGVSGGTLTNCILINNRIYGSDAGGAGVYAATLYNCLIAGNEIPADWGNNQGGGARASTLFNCTVVGNKARDGGGGVYGGTSVNSIVYFNSSVVGGLNWSATVFSNSCTAPTTTVWAAGNTTNNPIFVDQGSGYGWTNIPGNYRLSPVSTCINAGTNLAWMTNAVDPRSKDLDGQMRLRYGLVDMGCYEFIAKGSVLSFR